MTAAGLAPDDLYDIPDFHGLAFFAGTIGRGRSMPRPIGMRATIPTWRAATIPIPTTPRRRNPPPASPARISVLVRCVCRQHAPPVFQLAAQRGPHGAPRRAPPAATSRRENRPAPAPLLEACSVRPVERVLSFALALSFVVVAVVAPALNDLARHVLSEASAHEVVILPLPVLLEYLPVLRRRVLGGGGLIGAGLGPLVGGALHPLRFFAGRWRGCRKQVGQKTDGRFGQLSGTAEQSCRCLDIPCSTAAAPVLKFSSTARSAVCTVRRNSCRSSNAAARSTRAAALSARRSAHRSALRSPSISKVARASIAPGSPRRFPRREACQG